MFDADLNEVVVISALRLDNVKFVLAPADVKIGIDYPKLTPEEFQVMIKSPQKSKLLTGPKKRIRRKLC